MKALYSTIMELKLCAIRVLLQFLFALYSTIMELKPDGWYFKVEKGGLFIAPLWN